MKRSHLISSSPFPSGDGQCIHRMHCRGRILRPSIAHRRNGFTLLEMVVALAVIVAAVGSTYSALLVLNRRAATTRAMNAAKTICEQHINQAQKVAYNPQYRRAANGTPELAKPELLPAILRVTNTSASAPADFPEGYQPPLGAEPFDVDQDSSNGTHCSLLLQTNAYPAAETMPAWVFRKVDPIGTEGLLSIRFIVCFTARGEMYSVQLDTMRSPDSLR